jgi:hypothetical protein
MAASAAHTEAVVEAHAIADELRREAPSLALPRRRCGEPLEDRRVERRDSERPELSGLVLSLVDKYGKPQNGFLQLQDIYNMSLNADLVVLSGCETALGKEIKGEGVLALSRGFIMPVRHEWSPVSGRSTIRQRPI